MRQNSGSSSFEFAYDDRPKLEDDSCMSSLHQLKEYNKSKVFMLNTDSVKSHSSTVKKSDFKTLQMTPEPEIKTVLNTNSYEATTSSPDSVRNIFVIDPSFRRMDAVFDSGTI